MPHNPDVLPRRSSEPAVTAVPGMQQRRHSRVTLPVAAEVSCMRLKRFREPAHLRDVSAGGAFLYAGLTPSVGTDVQIHFTVPVVGREVQVSCEGKVVRVESDAMGDKSGIAIEFSQLHLGSW